MKYGNLLQAIRLVRGLDRLYQNLNGRETVFVWICWSWCTVVHIGSHQTKLKSTLTKMFTLATLHAPCMVTVHSLHVPYRFTTCSPHGQYRFSRCTKPYFLQQKDNKASSINHKSIEFHQCTCSVVSTTPPTAAA